MAAALPNALAAAPLFAGVTSLNQRLADQVFVAAEFGHIAVAESGPVRFRRFAAPGACTRVLASSACLSLFAFRADSPIGKQRTAVMRLLQMVSTRVSNGGHGG